MFKILAKAAACSLGVHDWNEFNECKRCGRLGCVVGHHDWTETQRQVVVSPETSPNGALSSDCFYKCQMCGEIAVVSRVEEGYLGRA
jgi:hypothetical protein